MASDEVIWTIIDKQFCGYKLKTTKQRDFCRNEYNVTGLCNRQSCPLANSRYATVRTHPTKGGMYLYIKTVERAHLPSQLWEQIKLSPNYQEALKQINDNLLYWPSHLIHRCKQRLTRLTQVAMRMRKLEKEQARLGEKLVPRMAQKVRRREAARERKAEVAAKLEKTIERELLERLRTGAYGEQPLNVSEHIWQKVLSSLENEGEATRDKAMDEDIAAELEAEENLEYDMDMDEDEDENEDGDGFGFDDEEDDEEPVGTRTYVSDLDESDDELADMEDWAGPSSNESSDNEGSASSVADDNGKPAAKKPLRQPTKGRITAGIKRKRPGSDTKARKVARQEVEMEHEVEMERALDF